MVYPLRISAVSAAERSNILIYTCAANRLTFPDAETEYANRIDDEEARYISDTYPALDPLISEGCFVTKLRMICTPQEMDEDIYFESAPSNDEFREIRYSGLAPVSDGVLLALGLFLLGRPWRRGWSQRR